MHRPNRLTLHDGNFFVDFTAARTDYAILTRSRSLLTGFKSHKRSPSFDISIRTYRVLMYGNTKY